MAELALIGMPLHYAAQLATMPSDLNVLNANGADHASRLQLPSTNAMLLCQQT
jgi:hypothetical protein